jgi:hypothetical protein
MNLFLTAARLTRIVIPTVLPRRLHFRAESDVDQFSTNSIGSDARQSCAHQSLSKYEYEAVIGD